MFMPPMMPPFPPNTLPFPAPPTFAGLTDAEIAQLEGQERAAVEARVQVLRNISTLLDAAVLQFQQYMSIVPQPNLSYQPNVNGTAQPPPANPPPTTSTTLPHSSSFVAPSETGATIDSEEQPDQTLSPSSSFASNMSSTPPASTNSNIAPETAWKMVKEETDTASSSGTASTKQSPYGPNGDPDEQTIAPEDQEKLNEIRRRRLEKFEGGENSGGQ
jgi:hypothetical protein